MEIYKILEITRSQVHININMEISFRLKSGKTRQLAAGELSELDWLENLPSTCPPVFFTSSSAIFTRTNNCLRHAQKKSQLH